MVDFLIECNLRANRPGLLSSIMVNTTAKYEQDVQTMAELADQSTNPVVLFIPALLMSFA